MCYRIVSICLLPGEIALLLYEPISKKTPAQSGRGTKPDQDFLTLARPFGGVMIRHRSKHAYLMTSLAFVLAIVAGTSGLMRCLVQSPQSRAADYLLISEQTLHSNPLYAASAAWEAARINPSSPQAWEMLSRTLQQNGDDIAALQAQKIAYRLQGGGDPQPLYAMPAELRLSLLAHSEGDL